MRYIAESKNVVRSQSSSYMHVILILARKTCLVESSHEFFLLAAPNYKVELTDKSLQQNWRGTK